MCIRDSRRGVHNELRGGERLAVDPEPAVRAAAVQQGLVPAVSYTHLRAHETVLDLVCRLLLEKKKQQQTHILQYIHADNHLQD